MAKLKQATFNKMVTAAEDFVNKQKGKWGEDEWLDLLALLKQAGMDLSEEMQAYLRQLLEAMRGVYQATGSTQRMTAALTTTTKDSVEFVKVHKAIWGYGDWEDFAEHVKQRTKVLSKETSSYLGDILDSLKALYGKEPGRKAPLKKVSPAGKKATAAKPAAARTAAVPTQTQPTAPIKPAAAPKPAATAKPAATPKPAAAKPAATKPAIAKPATPKPAAAKPKPAAPKATAKAATAKPARAPAKPKAAASNTADDLTAISGIGPALQKKLQDHGINQYAQIAALSPAEIADLETNIIKFTGRIKRDDWVAQAKRLSAQK